ncbi:hypothetical protein AK812_SmicGene45547, partial [Symbiodinium microadriaticum]
MILSWQTAEYPPLFAGLGEAPHSQKKGCWSRGQPEPLLRLWRQAAAPAPVPLKRPPLWTESLGEEEPRPAEETWTVLERRIPEENLTYHALQPCILGLYRPFFDSQEHPTLVSGTLVGAAESGCRACGSSLYVPRSPSSCSKTSPPVGGLALYENITT